ncbi:BtaA family protein [Mameliella alba]|nr:BtaA family protein [Antarctobacter heliothermus]MBY6144128.1 BtaA family protein [Mameliella alba]MBY6161580.1 BtaA family protein [Mameliella alba]MBY6169954.1 BtaA family protein [Mameliella alba]MBY6175069.1 BtaA family protein [Mameliella alba]
MDDRRIDQRASFERIRYAQAWEDADVLTQAMGEVRGGELVAVCSSGDNALALLLSDPAAVHAVDISPAQIECLNLRLGAYAALTHAEFLELMGARASTRRAMLLSRALSDVSDQTRAFWADLTPQVEAHGAGGVGKFEGYFRLFSRYMLPLVHSRATIDGIFEPRDPAARQAFFDTRFDTWRWRLLVKLFFSRAAMGLLGRDPAFFEHVQGSVADHVFSRLRHAGIDTDPSQNPYLHWIMKRCHGTALPLPWRAEAYEVIRHRLDRIRPHPGTAETLNVTDAAGFYLSDIFEYMSPDLAARVYGRFLDMARPGARLVYWNMMAPRRVPAALAERVTTLTDLETRLKAQDKAFFYSDFVVEEIR